MALLGMGLRLVSLRDERALQPTVISVAFETHMLVGATGTLLPSLKKVTITLGDGIILGCLRALWLAGGWRGLRALRGHLRAKPQLPLNCSPRISLGLTLSHKTEVFIIEFPIV